MKAIVLATALGALAVGGMAAASSSQFPQDFHGLRVLTNSDGESSGRNARPVTTKLGPYDSDAVLIVTWEGEVSFAQTQGLAHANIALTRDGVALSAEHPAATFAGSGSFRTRGDEKLFLARGQQTTLSMVATGDPGGTTTERALLAVTAIATTQ